MFSKHILSAAVPHPDERQGYKSVAGQTTASALTSVRQGAFWNEVERRLDTKWSSLRRHCSSNASISAPIETTISPSAHLDGAHNCCSRFLPDHPTYQHAVTSLKPTVRGLRGTPALTYTRRLFICGNPQRKSWHTPSLNPVLCCTHNR